MSNFNPDKLHIEFRDGVTEKEPVLGRKYTLTHSDITAELFLTIGLQFAYDKTNAMRDELLAEWRIANDFPYLHVYVYLDGQFAPDNSEMRDKIFRRELPLALEAIRYGDAGFFDIHPDLDSAQIWIHFDSSDQKYSRFEYYGMPGDYK